MENGDWLRADIGWNCEESSSYEVPVPFFHGGRHSPSEKAAMWGQAPSANPKQPQKPERDGAGPHFRTPGRQFELQINADRVCIDVCILNERSVSPSAQDPGLPLEALRSLTMQASIGGTAARRWHFSGAIRGNPPDKIIPGRHGFWGASPPGLRAVDLFV